MPRQNTATETRLNTVRAYLTPAFTLLDELSDAFGCSFVQPISKTALLLITVVQVMNFMIIICQWQ
jgi:hypothetical protein